MKDLTYSARIEENISNERLNNEKEIKRKTERDSSEKSMENQNQKRTRSKEKVKHDLQDRKITKPHNIIQDQRQDSETMGKIDTIVIPKNHMNIKDLELNFKHLKEVLEKHRFSIKENKVIPQIDLVINKRLYNDSNKTFNKHKYENADERNGKSILNHVDFKEFSLLDVSNDNEHQQSSFHDFTKMTQILSDFDNVSKKKEIIEFNIDNHPNPYKHILHMKTNSVEFTKDTNNNKVMDKISKELNNPSVASREIVQVGALNSAKTSVEDYEDDFSTSSGMVNTTVSRKYKVGGKKGKVFIQQTSSEYADHNGNLANELKPKYFNTY